MELYGGLNEIGRYRGVMSGQNGAYEEVKWYWRV